MFFLEVKKLLKLKFFDYFSKAKTEEYDEEDLSVSDKFQIFTACSARYHLEVGAAISMKAAIKGSLLR